MIRTTRLVQALSELLAWIQKISLPISLMWVVDKNGTSGGTSSLLIKMARCEADPRHCNANAEIDLTDTLNAFPIIR